MTEESNNAIIVKSKKTGRAVEFSRSFGETLSEAAELYGEDVVLSMFTASAVIRAQAAARAVLERDGSTDDEAIEAGMTYTPGIIRRRGTSAKEKAFGAIKDALSDGSLSQEELTAKIAELQAALAATDNAE